MPNFLTRLAQTAYRMLHQVASHLSGMVMRPENTDLVDNRFRETGRSAIADPAPRPDEDNELRAIEENYAVSHRVIASRVQKLLKRRPR